MKTTPRLDRLSALLEGLAPRIEVAQLEDGMSAVNIDASAQTFLHLHLLAMHASPHGRWTLESLAEEAGMSRTSFANTFREVMNQPPGQYLTKIRLSIARRAVLSGKGLKAAARESGYMNSSALSRALSRRAA
ncbi:MAG: helix-turn-helix domain-containing protein [Sulfuritalea sp.]|nr:helix-turn-helix domain-containing protein [Sulfuritalea sp.]